MSFHFLRVPFGFVQIAELNDIETIRAFFTTCHAASSLERCDEKKGKILAEKLTLSELLGFL